MFKPLHSLIFSLLAFNAGIASADVIVASHTWTGTEAVQGNFRLFRNAVSSVAGTAKAYPGASGNIPTYFFGWEFDALAGTVVSVTADASNSASSFFSIYNGAFNVANLASNYLGDAGASGASGTFGINAPSSGPLLLIANSVGQTGAIGALAMATVTFTPVQTSQVPEPASCGLFAMAGLGLLLASKRRPAGTARTH